MNEHVKIDHYDINYNTDGYLGLCKMVRLKLEKMYLKTPSPDLEELHLKVKLAEREYLEVETAQNIRKLELARLRGMLGDDFDHLRK